MNLKIATMGDYVFLRRAKHQRKDIPTNCSQWLKGQGVVARLPSLLPKSTLWLEKSLGECACTILLNR